MKDPTFHPAVYRWGSILIFMITASVILLRIRQNVARQRMIEGGFLSIHSNAIMWQAVVTAHHRALENLGLDAEGMVGSYRGYTEALSLLASELKTKVADVYEWIEGRSETHVRGVASGSSS